MSQNQALELSWGNGSTVFLSWTQTRTSSISDKYKVELSRQLGEKLGLKDGEQVEACVLCFVYQEEYHISSL